MDNWYTIFKIKICVYQTEVYAAVSQQTYGNIYISFICKQFTEINTLQV